MNDYSYIETLNKLYPNTKSNFLKTIHAHITVTLTWDINLDNNNKHNKRIMTSINKFTLNKWINIAINTAEALRAPSQSN